ncbi:hypothetical protein A1Q1_03800 [Trichosporon asahii var. asahii CBS 2479]|uniref:Uncharacterized protein n=1 Tax=Trichosporon asahii var. asahii (strain ATCC 90039 / CBS 2479 / JCM 2466 / KCTC 7840 / NBRC 103889/ NCYC 2677 / UAMH 7654) TaxID=1186058 RepID=J4U9S2_TRIAS|nr:hypothetical protein A1Q1_03800 [Trichosporon asahii var. asahii CBS 2479]EJT47415.1 hypothetical protein A1Q1_03800 [Trichosporon asahii var. asahii CBS 2479]
MIQPRPQRCGAQTTLPSRESAPPAPAAPGLAGLACFYSGHPPGVANPADLLGAAPAAQHLNACRAYWRAGRVQCKTAVAQVSWTPGLESGTDLALPPSLTPTQRSPTTQHPSLATCTRFSVAEPTGAVDPSTGDDGTDGAEDVDIGSASVDPGAEASATLGAEAGEETPEVSDTADVSDTAGADVSDTAAGASDTGASASPTAVTPAVGGVTAAPSASASRSASAGITSPPSSSVSKLHSASESKVASSSVSAHNNGTGTGGGNGAGKDGSSAVHFGAGWEAAAVVAAVYALV